MLKHIVRRLPVAGHFSLQGEGTMGNQNYIVLGAESSWAASYEEDRHELYDPVWPEDVKIEFTVPPRTVLGVESEPRNPAVSRDSVRENASDTERRLGKDRRSGSPRRRGSTTRRCWQEPQWIGAPDCRNGLPDRRQEEDRRAQTDRRRK